MTNHVVNRSDDGTCTVQIQKALFYSLATHSNMEHDDPDGEVALPPVQDPDIVRPNLSPELTQRCKDLLTRLVSHFTPILFTVATANHMACTDVFAEAWMPLVIQPALESGGLCRPLEPFHSLSILVQQAHVTSQTRLPEASSRSWMVFGSRSAIELCSFGVVLAASPPEFITKRCSVPRLGMPVLACGHEKRKSAIIIRLVLVEQT